MEGIRELRDLEGAESLSVPLGVTWAPPDLGAELVGRSSCWKGRDWEMSPKSAGGKNPVFKITFVEAPWRRHPQGGAE